ncbi:hypothetical protein Cantr_00754 [Candida viswanathii]|uniref:Uncharacterized protein n=1 Tax=Candida viswanathii TaxID=5486 RepID=A0A367YHB1_9ASCO|nr:hypothetical protein Cantr_00754 [Candida viswanathii]
MVSPTTIKWLKITYSTIVRLIQLGWLGAFGLVVGVLAYVKGYTLGIYAIILYAIVLVVSIYLMVIAPLFKWKTSITVLVLFDLLAVLANVGFYVTSRFTTSFLGVIVLAICGIACHCATLIPLATFSLATLIAENGFAKALKLRERFLYGSVFLRDHGSDRGPDANNVDVTMFDDLVRKDSNDTKTPFTDSELGLDYEKPRASELLYVYHVSNSEEEMASSSFEKLVAQNNSRR